MAVEPEPATLPPGLLERLRSRSRRSARTGSAADAEPSAENLRPAVIFVTVFGLSAAALEAVLEAVIRAGRDAPATSVFLTDRLDFEPFLARGLRFEYLPDGGRRQRFAPDLDWRTYERRRYRLLARKWRPQALISFGTPPPPDCAATIEAAS